MHLRIESKYKKDHKMGSKPLVLIVEDNVFYSKIIKWSIHDKFDSLYTESGEECLELINNGTLPDIILLDVTMPGISGHETCRRLKKEKKSADIPIIFITALDECGDEKLGFDLGAVDYITKPVNPAIVRARIDTHITMKLQRDELNRLAFYDQLTGVYNRHWLLEVANDKVNESLRNITELWLLMIDIDNFKSINDTHGHAVGDLILQKIANNLKTDLRSHDTVSRFGGEEFIVLFSHCNKINTLKKANKLIKNIEALKPNGIVVTISIGVSSLLLDDDNDDLISLLKRADDALYQAKNNGRNRLEIC